MLTAFTVSEQFGSSPLLSHIRYVVAFFHHTYKHVSADGHASMLMLLCIPLGAHERNPYFLKANGELYLILIKKPDNIDQ